MSDKTDHHKKIYDNYNTELASTKIKSITLENASITYSSFNSRKFDTSGQHNKFLLHNHFVAWHCKGCSIAPFSDYKNNPVFQELPTQSEYSTALRCVSFSGKISKKKHLWRHDKNYYYFWK